MPSILSAFQARLVGSGVFYTSDQLVNSILSLHFRIHFHLNGDDSSQISPSTAKVLLEEATDLLSQRSGNEVLNNLFKKILNNSVGIIYYSLGEEKDAQSYFDNGNLLTVNEPTYNDFATYLNLENLYYRNLIAPANKSSCLLDALKILGNKLPSQSCGLTYQYLSDILIEQGKSKPQDFKEFTSQIENNDGVSNVVLAYFVLQMYGSSTPGFDEYVFAMGDKILKKSKFPMANQTNNTELDHFHFFLKNYFRDIQKQNKKITISKNWKSFIVSSIGSTFQSANVAKSGMLYFGIFGSSDNCKIESILNFVNFVKYSKRVKETDSDDDPKSAKYDNLISVIDAYAFILQLTKNESSDIENVFNFQNTLSCLEELLKEFYSQNLITYITESDCLDWSKLLNRVKSPNTVSDIIRKGWEILYEFRNNDLNSQLYCALSTFLANAICMAREDKPSVRSELQFKYAYTLAQGRQIESAVDFLKSVVLEKYPEFYKAWHLLALCESSIHEDKEVSFKIVCSVLEAMKEAYEEKKLSTIERWQFIQMKLTQLGIIEEIFGTLEALELLPEVFQLYAQLFPEGETKYDRIGPEYSDTKEYLLQYIWLFAADMYVRLDDEHFDDAKEAITEALNVTSAFKNLNCNLSNGYLLLGKGELKKALKEFETVLFYDDCNPAAMIGFAEILFPEEEGDESDQLVENYYMLTKNSKETTKKEIEVFANNKDKSAAYARLKFLLEYSLTKSIEAYNSPEVWWYLALIYEKYQDSRYKETLLNCIRYKEAAPIRKFKFCNY
ncbi:hypothetical protein Kpol_1050p30 [Vanderwaltozyma polyspora DSM 70294]|uniref:Cargo-transport protein YPP1 n=1 Tax=Vanderwaltozyma polyspora (strain ATCC 22028 / DSM 70294 / BCRC 21397 / CBS 2163 / NBRC 10782 / NRRL Y-8283 / UCD 57-17) TaxID=436907 RepID=A7TES7_VANPO|nr:uncharacterized protein Kpol_1050p30 [Vanderwaltozyma polyspora DSM 70294]EDO19173.1 hypothetical protein Kpol_1050p30 [Vanderwaltozyma polyspora DSM 70294]